MEAGLLPTAAIFRAKKTTRIFLFPPAEIQRAPDCCADNTKYFSIVNGSIRMNPLGIEERLKANSIVLERYESVFGKCEDLKRRVRTSMESATANFVVNDHLQRRDKRGAKRYLIQVCRRFPKILASKVGMVLLLKTLLNDQVIRILRQLASRFSSGDQQQSREAKAVASRLVLRSQRNRAGGLPVGAGTLARNRVHPFFVRQP